MLRRLMFRGVPYVDREREERFLLGRLNNREPTGLLFIYGPKSSGKTTFIEYIVEERLRRDERFYVNYVNFRRYAIVNYDSFLNIYFKPITEKNKGMLARMRDTLRVAVSGLKGEVSIPEHGVNYMISFDLYSALQERNLDPFDLMFDVLRKLRDKGKIPVLIIDEVQELRDIYMNGERKQRYLLTEFFKFLVGLTKETHLAHVIICTSSSIFIDEIYNHSNLAQTSKFYLFDHLDYETTKAWLQEEGFTEDETDLIWEFFGGCPYNIQELLADREAYGSEFDLRKYLIQQAEMIRGRIKLFVVEELEDEKEETRFAEILKAIVEKGYVENVKDKLFNRIVKKAIEKDILFLLADKDIIIFNSQIMKKGAEVYLGYSLL